MAQFQGNTGDTFKRNTNFTRSQRPRTIDKQEQKKIYVGWANTYLAQREFPELINDLQKDINKGLILINLMESIVGERIPHVCRNPYYQNQKLANVINCLKYLNKKGIAIHYGIATDIVNGDLKAILSLFFSLTQLEHQIKLQKSKQKAINDNDEQRMASNSYNSLSLRRVKSPEKTPSPSQSSKTSDQSYRNLAEEFTKRSTSVDYSSSMSNNSLILSKKNNSSLSMASDDNDKVWNRNHTEKKARNSLSQSSSFDSHEHTNVDSGPSLSSSSSAGSINTCLRAEGVNVTGSTSDNHNSRVTAEKNKGSQIPDKSVYDHYNNNMGIIDGTMSLQRYQRIADIGVNPNFFSSDHYKKLSRTTSGQSRKSSGSIEGHYQLEQQNTESDFNRLRLQLPDMKSKPDVPPRYSDNNQSMDYNSDSDIAAHMRRRKFAIDHHISNKNDYLQHLPTKQEENNLLRQHRPSLKLKEHPSHYIAVSRDDEMLNHATAGAKKPSYEEHIHQQGSEKLHKSHSTNKMTSNNVISPNSGGYVSDSGPAYYDDTKKRANSRKLITEKRETANQSKQQIGSANTSDYIDLLRHSSKNNPQNHAGDRQVKDKSNYIDRTSLPVKKLSKPEKSPVAVPSNNDSQVSPRIKLKGDNGKKKVIQQENESGISKRPQKLIKDNSHPRKKFNKKHAEMNKFLRNLNLVRSRLIRSASDSTLNSPIVLQITKFQSKSDLNDSFKTHLHKSLSDSALYNRCNRKKNHGYTINYKSILSSGIPVKTILSPYVVTSNKKAASHVSQTSINWSLEPNNRKGATTPGVKSFLNVEEVLEEFKNSERTIYELKHKLNNNVYVFHAFQDNITKLSHDIKELREKLYEKDIKIIELQAGLRAYQSQHEINISSKNLLSRLGKRNTGSAGSNTDSGSTIQLDRSDTGSIDAGQLTDVTTDDESAKNKKKKKSWIGFRSSFASRKKSSGRKDDIFNADIDVRADTDPNSPRTATVGRSKSTRMDTPPSIITKSITNQGSTDKEDILDSSTSKVTDLELIDELRTVIKTKDERLNRLQREAVTSNYQSLQLTKIVKDLQTQILQLRLENEKLNFQANLYSLKTPEAGSDESISFRDDIGVGQNNKLNANVKLNQLVVKIYVGSSPALIRLLIKLPHKNRNDITIGYLQITSITLWRNVDEKLTILFKRHCSLIDPEGELGLSASSIECYEINTVKRYIGDEENKSIKPFLCSKKKDRDMPMLILIYLKSVQLGFTDSIVYQTLIPKFYIQRYLALLLDNRFVIIDGASGSIKTFLAFKLAEYLVQRCDKSVEKGIGIFKVTNNAEDLISYLKQQQSSGSRVVIILDELHHLNSLDSVISSGIFSQPQCPFIIGTINHNKSSYLKIHQNFRWILLSNDKPPISTLLEKYYAIRSAEFNPKPRNDAIPSVCKVFDKLPKMWSIINESILKFGSSQLMLGPKLFMSCPSDYQKSEIWFTDLWNYSIAPYVMELVRWKLENAPEASLADWKSPLQTILNTGNYPWQNNINQAKANLRDITPHDIQREPIPIKNVSDTEKSNTNNSEHDLMALLKRVMEINSPYASSDELPLESNI